MKPSAAAAASFAAAVVALLLAAPACAPLSSDPPAGYTFVCATSEEAAFETAGGQTDCGAIAANDPNLPPEPTFPDDVCRELRADKSTPDESRLDTARVQEALNACRGRAVKLVADGDNDAFITAHLDVDSVVLWIDEGVTLYASRNAELYQATGNCGKLGVNDASACQDYITVMGESPGIVGDGKIDGQGGEPLVGQEYSWWQSSEALRAINGSIGNPTLVNVRRGTTNLLLYRITLVDSPKFHAKITSNPPDGICDSPGKGFIVWGVTVFTPSKLHNSQGILMTPHFARNTDGIDPGTIDRTTCGVMACNTITTGDDQIAIKGGHLVRDLIIAHNHMGTGHGMSIGSETYGERTDDGVLHRGVQNVLVYDLTIDAASRSVGYDGTEEDFNGIRIKSDISRGGVVSNITFRDICMRDMNNAILLNTAYNPLFAGSHFPEFGELHFQNVRHVTCMNTLQPVVIMTGQSPTMRTGRVTLDNVVIDNVGPPSVGADYLDVELGPGDVNFELKGKDVHVIDRRSGESTPRECVFPVLPTPELPEGWLTDPKHDLRGLERYD